LFLSSRETIEIVDTVVNSFGNVLVKYVRQGFTGRVTYRNTSIGTYISVELLKGFPVACRGVDRGNVVEGSDCTFSAMTYLYVAEGSVEVSPLPENEVLLDTLAFPHSVLSERDTFITTLLSSVSMAPPAPTAPKPAVAVPPPPPPQPKPSEPKIVQPPKPATPPPPPVTAPQPPQPPPAPQVKEPAVAKAAEAPPPPPPVEAEVTVTRECIDPVTLYSILRSSTMVAQIGEAMYSDVVAKLSSLARESKAKFVYTSANAPNGKVRALLDAESMRLYIEFEDQSGKTVCGNEAAKLISSSKLTAIRMWAA
jgi:hypothetical protein